MYYLQKGNIIHINKQEWQAWAHVIAYEIYISDVQGHIKKRHIILFWSGSSKPSQRIRTETSNLVYLFF